MPIMGDLLGPLGQALRTNRQRDIQQDQFNQQQILEKQKLDALQKTQGLQNKLLEQKFATGESTAKTKQEEFRLKVEELTPFARTLKNLDDQNKAPALQNEIDRRREAGLPENPLLQEGLQQLQNRNFEGFNSSLDEIIKLSGKGTRKSFKPVQTTDEEGNVGLGIPSVDAQGNETLEPVDLQGLSLTKETPEAKRAAQLQAAISEEQGKLIARDRQQIRTEIKGNARQARRELANIAPIEAAFAAIETGKLAQVKRLLGPFIPGVDPTNEQALQAEVNKLVMAQIKNLPGALSEKELGFAMDATASLGFTKEANLLIISRLKALYEGQINEQKQFDAFKGNPEDFEFQFATPESVEDVQGRQQEVEKTKADTKMFGTLSQDKLDIIQQLRDKGLTDEQIQAGMNKKGGQ